MKRTALALTVIASVLISLVSVVDAPSSSSSALSVPPAMEWDAQYGGNAGLSASRVIQTSDGGYALAGKQGAHTLPPSVWLVKTDATGKMEWNQTYDYLLNAAGLVQTSDEGYVIAGDSYTQKEAWGPILPPGIMIVKTDRSGNVQWKRTFTEWSGGASSMVQTNDGGYIIAGSVDRGAVTFNGPYYEAYDGFLIKTDSSGNIQWHKTYGEHDKFNVFSSVFQTNDGGYAIAGTTNFNGSSDIYDLYFCLVKTDANGNVIWNQTYGSGPATNVTGNILNMDVPGDNQANSVVQTADGGYVLTGNTFTYGAGASDAWLVKTDSLGNMVWNQTYGGAGLVTIPNPAGEPYVTGSNGTWYDFAYSLIQTSDGGLAFAGKTLMPLNNALAWLVKLDAVGNAEWNQTYPNRSHGGGGWSANCLIATSDGGFALAGSWDPTSSVNFYYLVKTEPVLPPPTPTPTPSSPPSTGILSGENLALFASLAVAAVLIALVAVAVFRRRKKQTLPASFT